MSNSKSSLNTCILPSDLTPEQLESLSFVPGVLTNFDEKEKLPPTARAQWTYVQLNPIDFLNRFSNELGLLGVNVAISFINKELYEDPKKELKTPITVNLIVQPEHIADIAEHLQEKNISHQVLEDDKGFALPYLGSIQKTVDALSLESLVSYMFIKNSISREAYSSWLSVPKKYLEIEKPKKKSAKLSKFKKKQAFADANQQEEQSENPEASNNSKKQTQPKEDFNYVIYDDTGETTPPIIPQPEDPKPQSVVVANPPPKKKKSIFSKLAARSKSKKADKKPKQKSKACPLAKFNAAHFVFLSLFNLHCSILLLNFLGTSVEAFASIIIEATTGAAFISLLFTIFVIRPSFRIKEHRLWSLLGYVAYSGVAVAQIFRSFSFPDSAGYLVPGALTIVFIMGAVVTAFMRIDRMSSGKGTQGKEEVPAEEDVEEEMVEIELEATIPTPEPVVAQKAIDLPAPKKKKAKKEDTKKIELKPVKKAAPKQAEPEPEVPVQEQAVKKVNKVSPKKSIPATPITEQQKAEIRNRLSRKETLSTPSAPTPAQTEKAASTSQGDEQKPLSTAEIKARLAERLQQTRATNSGLSNVGKPAEKEPTPEEPVAQESTQPKKATLKKRTTESKGRANKLSLPNS